MFTVRHTATDGTVSLYQANKVESVNKGDDFVDGIYLDREQSLSDEAEGSRGTFAQCFTRALPGTPTKEPQKVIVMNERGATVAVFSL